VISGAGLSQNHACFFIRKFSGFVIAQDRLASGLTLNSIKSLDVYARLDHTSILFFPFQAIIMGR
jgi:hypothetical protein